MVDLSSHNTLRLPAKAKKLLNLTSKSDLEKLSYPSPIILGHGANVLFRTPQLDTVVINQLTGRQVTKDSPEFVIVRVAAGQSWHEFVTWAVQNNLSGIENMALIPGTVGAAPIGNIGAYGQSIDQTLHQVRFYDLTSRKTKLFSNSDCQLLYRDSVFKRELKNQFVILDVSFKLSKTPHSCLDYYSQYESLQTEIAKIATPPYSIRDVYRAIISIRSQKMPDWKTIGTAGSFFKNPFVTKTQLATLQKQIPNIQYYPTTGMDYPQLTDPRLTTSDYVKIPAGHLLDHLGWKGRQTGHVSTFAKHALVITTHPGATGQEVFEFTESMRADVKNNFQIDLEYEVVII